MPLSHQVDPSRNIVVVVGVGTVTFDELLRTIRAAASEVASHQCGSLADVREMDYFPSTVELRSIALEFIRLRAAFRCGVAFVVSNDRHYGLVRLLAALVESGGVRIEVFRDRGEAEEWLKANNPESDRPPVSPS